MAVSRGDDRLSGRLGDVVLEGGDLLIMDAAEVAIAFHYFYHRSLYNGLFCHFSVSIITP